MRDVTFKMLIFVLTGILMCLAASIVAQTVVPDTLHSNPYVVLPSTSVNDLLNMYTLLYAAIVNVVTYIASFFKPALKIKPALRALAIGAITGLVFYSLGIADGWQLALGFVAAALNYDKVLKPFGLETPKKDKRVK